MKNKLYKFAYTGLSALWTNKFVKDFFHRKRNKKRMIFRKYKPKKYKAI